MRNMTRIRITIEATLPTDEVSPLRLRTLAEEAARSVDGVRSARFPRVGVREWEVAVISDDRAPLLYEAERFDTNTNEEN